MKKKIIVLFGLKGSGKTTVARMLKGMLPETVIMSFATPIKKGLSVMFNIPLRDLSDPQKKEDLLVMDKTYRHLMQTLGTEWGKGHINPTLWAWLALENVKSEKWAEYVVFDDARFPADEYTWLKAEAEKVGIEVTAIFIERRGMEKPTDNHSSETSMMGYKYPWTFKNPGTARLKKLLQTFVKHRILEAA